MEKRYLEMYKEAAQINTCVFVNGICQNGECCCTECLSLKANGSCAIKSLLCKLWICPEVRRTMDTKTIGRLQELWNEAESKKYLVFRGTPETATDELTLVQSPGGRFTMIPVGSQAGPINQRSFKGVRDGKD